MSTKSWVLAESRWLHSRIVINWGLDCFFSEELFLFAFLLKKGVMGCTFLFFVPTLFPGYHFYRLE